MESNDHAKQAQTKLPLFQPHLPHLPEPATSLLPSGSPTRSPTMTKLEHKIQKIFQQFRFQSFTFQLFLVNCIMWIMVHAAYYAKIIPDWNCVQYRFFAKFQPSITYHKEIYRIFMSSFMFRGWLQFYFNNFALNMLGYSLERLSLARMLIIFYLGIVYGHMLSCCFSNPDTLSTGTSCGTIALLPLQICRYLKLSKTNPIQAQKRRRFLIFNISCNFILNALAIVGLDPVDWISHIGCIISGCLCLLIFEGLNELIPGLNKPIGRNQTKVSQILRWVSIASLAAIFVGMSVKIWYFLPSAGHGETELHQMEFSCSRYPVAK